MCLTFELRCANFIILAYGVFQYFMHQVEGGEYCIPSQSTPLLTNYCTYFCCGNSSIIYCCSDCSKRIGAQSYWCGNDAQNSTAIILGCTVGLTIFVAVILLLPSIKKCLVISTGRLLRIGHRCPNRNATHASTTDTLGPTSDNTNNIEAEIQPSARQNHPRPPPLSINTDILFIRSELSLTFAPPSPLPPYKETDPESQPPSFEDALRPETLSAVPSDMISPAVSPMRYDGFIFTNFPLGETNVTNIPCTSVVSRFQEDTPRATPPPPYSESVTISNCIDNAS